MTGAIISPEMPQSKRDYYTRRAREEGYPSRAAYKLLQIQDKYHIISPRDVVIDLGAAPGGWSQVAAGIVGRGGRVISADIEPVKAETQWVQGDVTREETLAGIKKALGKGKADVVLSDLSPSTTGSSVDHARSVYLAQHALCIARETLRSRGNYVVKVFQGELYNEYFGEVKRSFVFCKGFRPGATKSRSAEIYVVAKSFRETPS